MKIKQHLGFISMLAIAFTACQQKPAETDNFLENEIKNIEAQHTLQTDLIEKSGEPSYHRRKGKYRICTYR